jgi:hypothetical protein
VFEPSVSLYSTNEYRGSMHDRHLLLLAGLAKYAPVSTRRKLFYMCGISRSKAILQTPTVQHETLVGCLASACLQARVQGRSGIPQQHPILKDPKASIAKPMIMAIGLASCAATHRACPGRRCKGFLHRGEGADNCCGVSVGLGSETAG